MSLNPYLATLADGVRSSAETEAYDVNTRGRKGAIIAYNVTAVTSGFGFVDGSAPSLPVTVDDTNDLFAFDGTTYSVAPGTYETLAALVAAIAAAATEGPTFGEVVTVEAEADHVRYVSNVTGADARAFAVDGGADALVPVLGLTDAATISDTEAGDSTDTATITVKGKDEVSGEFWTIGTADALTDTGFAVFQIHPTISEAAGERVASMLPAHIRIEVAHTADADVTRTLAIQLVG